ncbi:MAG: DUF3846 domain-containing protein [Bacilli bacterium]
MQRFIKALKVEPNKLPEEIIVQNTLKAKQAIVGGDIEYTYLENDESIAIICNECGKLDGLPYNRDIGHDIIAGTFLIVRDEDTGEDRSLLDEQIKKYKKRFDEKSIIDTNTKITEIMLSKNKIEVYEI